MKTTLTNWTKIHFSLSDRIRILLGAKVHVKTVFVAHHDTLPNGHCVYNTSVNEVESLVYIDGMVNPFHPENETKKTVDFKDNYDYQV